MSQFSEVVTASRRQCAGRSIRTAVPDGVSFEAVLQVEHVALRAMGDVERRGHLRHLVNLLGQEPVHELLIEVVPLLAQDSGQRSGFIGQATLTLFILGVAEPQGLSALSARPPWLAACFRDALLGSTSDAVAMHASSSVGSCLAAFEAANHRAQRAGGAAERLLHPRPLTNARTATSF
jgi:hypothetical protein